MDGLSRVASGFAVVSLAGQLLNGFISLYDLISSIKDAPNEIAALKDDLKIICEVLRDVEATEVATGMDPTTTIVIESCGQYLRSLEAIADSLVPGFASNKVTQRTWTAIKAVRRKEKISAFRLRLSEAKANLLLARTSALNRSTNQHFQEQKLSFNSLETTISKLCQELAPSKQIGLPQGAPNSDAVEVMGGKTSDSPYWPIQPLQQRLESELKKAVATALMNLPESSLDLPAILRPKQQSYRKSQVGRVQTIGSFLGELQYFITTYRIVRQEDDLPDSGVRDDTKITVRFLPSWLLRKLWISVIQLEMMRSSTLGWQTKIRSYNIVPSTSGIFQFCRKGDIQGVRTLLATRETSVNDVSEFGETPLHVAASGAHSEVCRLLLQEGADSTITDDSTMQTPFLRACCPSDIVGEDREIISTRHVPFENVIATMRVFIEGDEHLDDAHSMEMISNLMVYENCMDTCGKSAGIIHASESPSEWLMNRVLPSLIPLVLDQDFLKQCLHGSLYRKPGRICANDFVHHLTLQSVREVFLEWLSTVLPTFRNTNEECHDFQFLRSYAGGLNFLAKNQSTNQEHTLLSSTLYSSFQFLFFRYILWSVRVNIEDFVEQELKIYSDGWTKETLMTLFKDTRYVPIDILYFYDFCRTCKTHQRTGQGSRHEVPWERRIRRIKAGEDPDGSLNEQETAEQEEWEEAYNIFRDSHRCYEPASISLCF